MKKILITGFKPFLNEIVNPSEKLALHLVNSFNSLNKKVDLACEILPVEFESSYLQLKKRIQNYKPDYLLMMGLAVGRKNICLERIALNWRQTIHKDERGFLPSTGAIFPDKELALMTGFPIDSIYLMLRQKNFPVEISFSAGTFVCNEIYFRALNDEKFDEKNFKHKSVFVHLPRLAEKPDPNQQAQSESVDFDTQLHILTEMISYLIIS